MSSVPETPIAAKVGGKLTVKADEVVEVNGSANEKFACIPYSSSKPINLIPLLSEIAILGMFDNADGISNVDHELGSVEIQDTEPL